MIKDEHKLRWKQHIDRMYPCKLPKDCKELLTLWKTKCRMSKEKMVLKAEQAVPIIPEVEMMMIIIILS